MANKNYRKALYQAKQELAHELVERQKSDQKVARLQALITQLQDLCAEQDQKRFWNSIDGVVKADLKGGITQTIRVLLKERSLPMTATDLKAGIEARKYDLGGLAQAFTSLKSGCPALLAFLARGRGFWVTS